MSTWRIGSCGVEATVYLLSCLSLRAIAVRSNASHPRPNARSPAIVARIGASDAFTTLLPPTGDHRMSLDSECDHVAVAVPSIEEAAPRWQAGFGGHWLSPRPEAISDFRTRQLRFNGGGKLELLEPTGQTGFAAAFLARFGARIHHVTLKVPDLLEAVETVRTAGYDVVDVSTERDEWHEGFLRPSQVGGVIVQLAYSPLSEEEWARQRGIDPVPTPVDGPVLLGPTFTHPDLDVAETVWRTLGAAID